MSNAASKKSYIHTRGFHSPRKDNFLSFLRSGHSINASCKRARIDPSQFYEWLKQADYPNADPEKVEFKEEVMAITGSVQGELECIIFEHAKTEWKAALEILRRRYKEDWGDPREPVKAPETSTEAEVTKEQWAALAELVAKKL